MSDLEDGEVGFEFILSTSEDGRLITLSCELENEIDPDHYLHLLKNYVKRLETLITFSDESGGTFPN